VIGVDSAVLADGQQLDKRQERRGTDRGLRRHVAVCCCGRQHPGRNLEPKLARIDDCDGTVFRARREHDLELTPMMRV